MQLDLLLRVGLLALRRMNVPRYRTKFSKHVFTQHQHLMVLALKELKKTSYRSLIEELEDSKAVERYLGLVRIPHFTTPQKFLARTQPKWLNLLMARLVHLITTEVYGALDATCWRLRAASTHYLNRLGQQLEVRDTWKSSDLFDVPTGLFVATKGKPGLKMEGGDLPHLIEFAPNLVEAYGDAQYDQHRNWRILKSRRVRTYINHKMGKSAPGRKQRGPRKAAYLRKLQDPLGWQGHYRYRTRIEGAYHAMKALLGDHIPGRRRWMKERYRLAKYWAYDLQRIARRHSGTLGFREDDEDVY